MHTWKSALVCILIAMLSIGVVYTFVKLWIAIKCSEKNYNKCIRLIIYCTISILMVFHLQKYTDPDDRIIIPHLYHTVTLPIEENMSYPGLPWHAIYEQYGLYSSSFFIEPTDEYDGQLGFKWPNMDFSNHTYIVSYGWEIEHVSYNVWETIDFPIRTGACVGHVLYSGDFHPDKVFIYELPKIRIDHDMNHD